ncbi:MAG: hypothetical protein Q4A69_09245 [Moraxella sp.]|nr:hypothetical protein [Moraxella sp.]
MSQHGNFKRALGVKAVPINMPTSPNLWANQGGHYTTYHFYLPSGKIVFVSHDGCEIGAAAHAKLS